MTWPEPKPCKPKWYRVSFERMLRHIREDKCEQCHKLVIYMERESEIGGAIGTPYRKRGGSRWIGRFSAS